MYNPVRQIYPVLTIVLALGIVAGVAAWLVSKNRSDELTLAAGQPGGTYLPVARGMAERLSESTPNLDIRVAETEGSGENLEMIASGEADLAIVQNDMPHDGSARTLAPLHRGVVHFIVRADDDLQSIADLPGKRIATGPSRSGSPRIVDALLRHFSLDPDELDLRMTTLAGACKQLLAGEVDVILMPLGLKSEAVADLAASQATPVRFVPIGESIDLGSEIAGFLLDYPRAESVWIPRYAYAVPGESEGLPHRAIPAVGVRAMLVARADLSPRQAREVTESLFLNQSRLVEIHPAAAQISESFDRSTLQFPLHPGAEGFYRRNEPGFLVRYAEVFGLSLSFLIAAVGLAATSSRWLRQRKKDRIDAYYLELDQLLGRLQADGLEGEALVEIEAKLEALRHRAIRLLAEERLLPDESFRIFQGLLADCQRQVRERKRRLRDDR